MMQVAPSAEASKSVPSIRCLMPSGPGPKPTTTLGAFLMALSGVWVPRPTKLKVRTEKVAGVCRFGTLSQGLPLFIGRLWLFFGQTLHHLAATSAEIPEP